jgi:competence protein ComEC
MARAPVLTKEMRGITVKGWVELYEPRDKSKAMITLRVIGLGELPPQETPYRVRVTLPAASAKVSTGEAVSLKATLRPPPEPIAPHGFDFGRTGLVRSLRRNRLRHRNGRDARRRGRRPLGLAALGPGERGEIAAALITGERAGISEEDNQAMRDSGLFHILSISGLNMVIMAGTVFWLVRAGLALIPSIALRYPIRKWAAGAALAAALFLPASVRRRGADGAILDHDERRALGHDPRPAGAHHAQRGARRLADPGGRTREPVRSELREVVCRRGRPRYDADFLTSP